VTRLRLVAFKELRKLVETVGFKWVRREGSHNVIPDHGSQVIVRPLLRKILRDAGLTVEQYNRILDQL